MLELIATFKRAEADAAHKFGLIKAAAIKAPKPSKPATETALRLQNAGTRLRKSWKFWGQPQGIECRHRLGVTPTIGGCGWARIVKINLCNLQNRND